MFTNVFPFQTIILQSLFLLVSITIEGYIIHSQLQVPKKTSIEYSISINLVTSIMGWIAFFWFHDFIPYPLKAEMISYIFFDHFIQPESTYFNGGIIMAGFLVFLAAFIVKVKSLELLQNLLGVNKPNESKLINKTLKPQVETTYTVNQATVILFANACSHSVILIIIVLRSLQINLYYS